jgi:hypothetical protein
MIRSSMIPVHRAQNPGQLHAQPSCVNPGHCQAKIIPWCDPVHDYVAHGGWGVNLGEPVAACKPSIYMVTFAADPAGFRGRQREMGYLGRCLMILSSLDLCLRLGHHSTEHTVQKEPWPFHKSPSQKPRALNRRQRPRMSSAASYHY